MFKLNFLIENIGLIKFEFNRRVIYHINSLHQLKNEIKMKIFKFPFFFIQFHLLTMTAFNHLALFIAELQFSLFQLFCYSIAQQSYYNYCSHFCSLFSLYLVSTTSTTTISNASFPLYHSINNPLKRERTFISVNASNVSNYNPGPLNLYHGREYANIRACLAESLSQSSKCLSPSAKVIRRKRCHTYKVPA